MRFIPLQQAQPDPQLQQQAQELLAQLKDIHEPAPVGWWPPAPGWWGLGVLLLALVAAAVIFLWRARRKRVRNRYREKGVRLLQALDTADAQATAQINEIIKRVAVVAFGRAACANLTGRRWIEFLRGSADIALPQAAESALLEQLYRPDGFSAESNRMLRDYAIEWVKQHGVQRTSRQTELEAAAEVSRV